MVARGHPHRCIPVKLLAVDPSIRSVGLAVWDDTRLVWSSRVTLAKTEQCMGERCLRMAGTCLKAVLAAGHEPDELAFEWPKIFTIGKSKGDPNDLIPMAGVGMALAGLLAQRLTAIFTPWPSDWIGNIPKVCPKCKKLPGAKSCKVCGGSSWRTPRGRLIKESLTPEELALVHDQHDEIDGVGIGAWKRGRLVLRRVFPGAV